MKTKNAIAVALSLCCVVAACFALPSPKASSVTLVWEPSPSTNVVAYAVYWGTATRQYTNVVTGIKGCQVTLTNSCVRGTQYHFAATAIDDYGLESDYSEEAVWTPRGIPYPPGQVKKQLEW